MRLHSHASVALLVCLLCCRSAAEKFSLQACDRELPASHVRACQAFVSLLEDQSYCNLDQTQNCCVVLDAAATSRCHCWRGFSKATQILADLLYQHCQTNTTFTTTDSSQSTLTLKLFFGVLTSSANFEQRQAGTIACHCGACKLNLLQICTCNL